MSKPSAADTAGGVSLFPFLAVLLCTMGALIVVLVVLSRQVQHEVAAVSQPADPPPGELTPAEARELAELELAQLRGQRAATEDDLAEARAKLGHVEEHARRLQGELLALQDAARGLAESADDPAEAEALARRQAELETERQELESQLAQTLPAGPAAKSYAIVPYEGSSGTKRRPIYIECRADEVVIQPEGIVFTEQDFSGTLGPGNPLAAAMRAIREYWVVAKGAGVADDEQPYPLMVVRASGIRAYYVARAALRSWDEEFGYELVDDEWKLEYPNADPQLAQAARQAAGEARQREALAAAAAPRLRANRTRTIIGASPTGRGMVRQEVPVDGGGSGFSGSSWEGTGSGSGWGRGERSPSWVEESVPTGDAGDLPYASVEVPPPGAGSGTGDAMIAGATGAGGGASGPGSNGAGVGSTGGGATGDSLLGSGSTTEGEALVGGPGESGADSGWLTASGAGDSGLEAGLSPSGATGAGRAAFEGATGVGANSSLAADGGVAEIPGADSRDALGSAASAGGDLGSGGGTGGETSFLAGPPAGGSGGPRGTFGSAGSAGRGGGPAGGSSAAGGGAAGPGSSTVTGGPSGAAGSGGASTGNPQAAPSLSFSSSPPPDVSAEPLAGERGANWGVPAADAQSWPISRPLRLECYGDRLVLGPTAGRPRSGRVIELSGPTREGIDPLVQAIWTQMQSWGMAGQGMYWKPILSCTVAPDGEGRFADLAVLLADSGLEIRRREEPGTRLATPPVRAPR